MSEKLKEGVYIPMYVLGILVTVIMAIFSWGLATASASSVTKTNVENQKEMILTNKAALDKKANVDDVVAIKNDISEIKDLLYKHMGVK